MSKAVLISIQPQWCELIASRRKTLELRTKIPKIEPPYKCYIYCTKGTDHPRKWLGCYDHDMHKFGLISPLNIEAGKHMNIEVVSGLVIGEFVCDGIMRFCEMQNADLAEQQSCVKREKIYEYSGFGKKEVKGMNISDLVIYDKPKKLSEFNGICSKKVLTDCDCGSCKRLLENGNGHCPLDWIKHAPQSWQYVEEL